MPEADMFVPFLVSWLIVAAGLLVYYRPLSRGAGRLRVAAFVASGCSLAFLSVQTGIIDTKTGGFVALVLPCGTDIMLPHPYDYYLFYKLLPLMRSASLATAILCPLVYLLVWRAGSRRQQAAKSDPV